MKDAGTRYERQLLEVVRGLLDVTADVNGTEVERLLAQSLLHAPGFTLRGGTNEVLRGVVARELGLRQSEQQAELDLLEQTARDILGDVAGEDTRRRGRCSPRPSCRCWRSLSPQAADGSRRRLPLHGSQASSVRTCPTATRRLLRRRCLRPLVWRCRRDSSSWQPAT